MRKNSHTKVLLARATTGILGTTLIVSAASGVAHAQPVRGSYQVATTWNNVGPTPHFSGVDQRLHKVFVSNLAAGTVTVLNSQTGTPITTITLGGTVHTVVVDQQNQRVYVTDIQRGLLDVINAQTDTLITEIPVAAHLHGLAVSQRLHEAFVTDISLSKVYAIDIKTNTVIDPNGTVVGPNPWGVSVNPTTKMLYVTNTGIDPYAGTATNPQGVNPAGDSVSVIDLRTMNVVSTVTVGPHPWNVVVDRKNGMEYVGVSSANEVAVLRGNKVIKDIPVGSSPHGVVIDYRNHTLFVNNSVSNTVSAIDTTTNAVTQTIPVGNQPQGISVNQRTGVAYVVNQASATVSVLEPVRPQSHKG
ncbi:MAG: YncE family protein [Acidimicrobiales bacterium]